jgi:hypothetical protein
LPGLCPKQKWLLSFGKEPSFCEFANDLPAQ